MPCVFFDFLLFAYSTRIIITTIKMIMIISSNTATTEAISESTTLIPDPEDEVGSIKLPEFEGIESLPS